MKKKIVFPDYFAVFCYFCTKIVRHVTEMSKKYRQTSMEEPTDGMLQELMRQFVAMQWEKEE